MGDGWRKMQEEASYGAFGNIALRFLGTVKKILGSKQDFAAYVIDVAAKSCTITATERVEDNS